VPVLEMPVHARSGEQSVGEFSTPGGFRAPRRIRAIAKANQFRNGTYRAISKTISRFFQIWIPSLEAGEAKLCRLVDPAQLIQKSIR
jgi:hypothetical protein